MYADATTVPATTLYQGDIIADFPFYLFENGLPIQRNEAGHFELDQNAQDSERRLFAVEARKQQVMILSQTCDVQRRTNVIICPVHNLEGFIADNTLNADRVKSIRARKIYYWFYLPTYGALAESIADMQTMIHVPRAEIEKYLPNRITTLSDLGRHHLAWSLATYFGRPAEE